MVAKRETPPPPYSVWMQYPQSKRHIELQGEDFSLTAVIVPGNGRYHA
jgi:hypothetical protein